MLCSVADGLGGISDSSSCKTNTTFSRFSTQFLSTDYLGDIGILNIEHIIQPKNGE